MLQQKANNISLLLNRLYPSPPIPLNHNNIFSFLISVVLSAQTTDGKVNEVTKILFERAPTPERLSLLSINEVHDIIAPVGLAGKKAEYIINLSKKILTDFNGQVPNTYEGLESLPGVGHKTASVIMSQAFGEPALAVDTHVHRLANRWGLSKESNVDKVQKDLCSLFPQSEWNNIHLQMIYFGREYCPAKDHKSSECPICSWVNSPSKPPPTNFDSFRKHKKSKGIIYYEDRILEISNNPSLVSLSDLSPTVSNYFSSNNNTTTTTNTNTSTTTTTITNTSTTTITITTQNNKETINDNNNDNNVSNDSKIERPGLKRSTSQRASRKRIRLDPQ